VLPRNRRQTKSGALEIQSHIKYAYLQCLSMYLIFRRIGYPRSGVHLSEWMYRSARIRGGSVCGVRSFRLKKATYLECKKASVRQLVTVRSDHRRAVSSATIGVEREGRSGLLYRLAMMYYAAYLAVRARLYRADIALIDSGTTLYFALALLQVDC